MSDDTSIRDDFSKQTPSLTVVIPTLDEARWLPGLLGDLDNQLGVDLEVVVADGGSTDGTLTRARRADAKVVEASRGRGAQMNAGAEVACGDYVLFLHADSRVRDPKMLARALFALQGAIDRRGDDQVAGHFALRFADADRQALRYRYLEAKTALNRPNTTNGDQGFLMARRFFDALGGFDERMSFLEDQRLAEQIRDVGEWITLPGRLETSARRFETEGFARRYLLMAITMGVFDAGLDTYFEKAPEIYAAQQETDRLQMSPYLRLVWEVIGDLGVRDGLSTWLDVGRFARRNSWQLFFVLDVALQRNDIFQANNQLSHCPFIRLHDRLFEPLVDNVVGDVTAAALTFCAICGVAHPIFELLEMLESTIGFGAAESATGSAEADIG